VITPWTNLLSFLHFVGSLNVEKLDRVWVVDLKIDMVEVWGLSPHVPTISFIRIERIARILQP